MRYEYSSQKIFGPPKNSFSYFINKSKKWFDFDIEIILFNIESHILPFIKLEKNYDTDEIDFDVISDNPYNNQKEMLTPIIGLMSLSFLESVLFFYNNKEKFLNMSGNEILLLFILKNVLIIFLQTLITKLVLNFNTRITEDFSNILRKSSTKFFGLFIFLILKYFGNICYLYLICLSFSNILNEYTNISSNKKYYIILSSLEIYFSLLMVIDLYL